MEFNHPRLMNLSIVDSERFSMLSAFLLAACVSLPRSLPLQLSLVHTSTSELLSFTILVGWPHIGHLSGMSFSSLSIGSTLSIWGIIIFDLYTYTVCPLVFIPRSFITEMLWRLALSTIDPSISTGSNTAVGVKVPNFPIVQSTYFNVVGYVSSFHLSAIRQFSWCEVAPSDLDNSVLLSSNINPSTGYLQNSGCIASTQSSTPVSILFGLHLWTVSNPILSSASSPSNLWVNVGDTNSKTINAKFLSLTMLKSSVLKVPPANPLGCLNGSSTSLFILLNSS